jgi:hypothetical protein
MLPDFDKLGVFYLGRANDAPFVLPSTDFLTHAVVLGMTGSGKTGLSIGLLEEAAIDGIPVIAVDPKGDLANLLLTFPNLAPSDFAPWAPAGKTGEEEAAKWTKGLQDSGQDGARIQRLRDAVDLALYTPGSRAGTPISILGSLAAPPLTVREYPEAMRERVASTVSSLLGLVDVEADPVRSREHVLLSNIVSSTWAAGKDLDLGMLVEKIRDPGVERIGVLALESFYPKKDRQELAVHVNSLLASPGFEAWLEGAPLDAQSLLFTKEGKPRVSVISIAHLADAERSFFLSLLLGQLVQWMRAQKGTSSLRALFFMDEIAGYFPPVANPPTKAPLLLLLKQARAFGLGIVLATQNPVDLDYKGLSNAGTWFLGRLQTERDKARVLEGLEGALGGIDRAEMERTIAGLQPRQFLVHSVHADAPRLMTSRWTMSYLRGPLTRDEMRSLGGPVQSAAIAGGGAARAGAVTGSEAEGSGVKTPPPDGITEVFLANDASAVLRPHVLGVARVAFREPKTGLDFAREVSFVVPIEDSAVPVRWDAAMWVKVDAADLPTKPPEGARWAPMPPAGRIAKSYAAWSKKFVAWLCESQGIARYKSPSLGVLSAPGEEEGAFRARISHEGRVARDKAAADLRTKYAPKFAALEEKLRKAHQAVQREAAQAQSAGFDAALSVGGALVSMFGGGRASKVRGAAAAARSAGRGVKQQGDVARQKENVAVLEAKWRALEAEMNEKLAAEAGPQTGEEPLELVQSRPKKGDVTLELMALAWMP